LTERRSFSSLIYRHLLGSGLHGLVRQRSANGGGRKRRENQRQGEPWRP